MSDAFWANLPTLVVSLGTLIGLCLGAWAQYKVNVRQEEKLMAVQQATDGLADKMAAAAKGQGAAEGELKGMQQERGEARDRAAKDGERRAIVVDETLKSIESNTAETAVAAAVTAENTKKE